MKRLDALVMVVNQLTINYLSLAQSELPAPAEAPPEHSLKVFKSSGSSKYILVNTQTQAKEVVHSTLREFNMSSEVTANYALFKVTATNGVVKSTRLPDDAANLAEQIQLSSR